MRLAWTAVDSSHPRQHIVYWNTTLPDGRRASVARVFNPDGSWEPNGPWRWTIWANVPPVRGRGTPQHKGVTATAALSKQAVVAKLEAEAYAVDCPHCGATAGFPCRDGRSITVSRPLAPHASRRQIGVST